MSPYRALRNLLEASCDVMQTAAQLLSRPTIPAVQRLQIKKRLEQRVQELKDVANKIADDTLEDGPTQ